jgi:hypothetical protein
MVKRSSTSYSIVTYLESEYKEPKKCPRVQLHALEQNTQ